MNFSDWLDNLNKKKPINEMHRDDYGDLEQAKLDAEPKPFEEGSEARIECKGDPLDGKTVTVLYYKKDYRGDLIAVVVVNGETVKEEIDANCLVMAKKFDSYFTKEELNEGIGDALAGAGKVMAQKAATKVLGADVVNAFITGMTKQAQQAKTIEDASLNAIKDPTEKQMAITTAKDAKAKISAVIKPIIATAVKNIEDTKAKNPNVFKGKDTASFVGTIIMNAVATQLKLEMTQIKPPAPPAAKPPAAAAGTPAAGEAAPATGASAPAAPVKT